MNKFISFGKSANFTGSKRLNAQGQKFIARCKSCNKFFNYKKAYLSWSRGSRKEMPCPHCSVELWSNF